MHVRPHLTSDVIGEGPLLGANGSDEAENRSSRVAAVLLAAYRGSVSDFAMALVQILSPIDQHPVIRVGRSAMRSVYAHG